MTRWAFSHSHLRRQASSRLTIKSLNRFDAGVSLAVPLPLPQPAPYDSNTSNISNISSAYTTTPRSAYAVLRSRNTTPGTCGQNLLLSIETKSISSMCRCCCAALLYRVTEKEEEEEEEDNASPEEDRERDDFVFALKLASVEESLRKLLGEKMYESLVGPTLVNARQIGLCQEIPQIDEEKKSWVARLLLTPEEDNRVKWLHEDGVMSSTVLARVPSFKAMYVAYHTCSEENLDIRQFESIEERMKENKLEWDMSDAAVACSFAMKNEKLRPYLSRVIQNILLKEEKRLNEKEGKIVSEAKLRHVLGAIILLQCFIELRSEAQKKGGHISNPPTYLFSTATQLSSLTSKLSPSKLTSIIDIIAKRCHENVLSFAATCIVSSENPFLPDFTLWLLKEAPETFTCHRHFRRMVLRSQSEALGLLEKSGLLSTRYINLYTVVNILLPLLDECGHEDFFFLVIREVVSGMEERLRRDAHSFTEEDMRLIAALGTRLFEVPQQEGTHSTHHGSGSFDNTTRGQLEELQVMDGSPWALVAVSYSYLKEIVKALVRDNRRLKNQVQAQMRNIVEAVTSDTLNNNNSNNKNNNEVPLSSSLSSSYVGNKNQKNSNSSSFSSFSSFTNIEEEEEIIYVANTTTSSSSTNTSTSTTTKTSSYTSIPNDKSKSNNNSKNGVTPSLRLPTPPSIRERFVVFVEELVKAFVDETGKKEHKCMVVSNELFDFVNQHVPIPNIHDEYRRKIFLLVNVVSEKSSTNNETNETNDEIPAELRFLVTSLPLSLSPWASVMILREVLSESAGNNPRYTYVLNAAIDLQLPISTTRSRIATTLNMWRFLSSQAEKLTMKEQVTMKQRCVLNLPLAYILSSYWSLLTWMCLIAIVGLNVVGMDFESQYVATRLFDEFAPADEVLPPVNEEWNKEGAAELVSNYLEHPDQNGGSVHNKRRHRRSSEVLLSSASYIFLGTDDQRRPMTVIPISSESTKTNIERISEECVCASAVLRELALQVQFPFYLSIDQQLPLEIIIARAAEKIRRVSFNNAWFISRVIFRTFPLGRYHTEYSLVSHTCAQANLTRRRMTFMLYFNHNIPLTPNLLISLRDSVLAHNGNLVIVAHEDCLKKGGTTTEALCELGEGGLVRCIPYSKKWATSVVFGPTPTELSTLDKFFAEARHVWEVMASQCTMGAFTIGKMSHNYLSKWSNMMGKNSTTVVASHT